MRDDDQKRTFPRLEIPDDKCRYSMPAPTPTVIPHPDAGSVLYERGNRNAFNAVLNEKGFVKLRSHDWRSRIGVRDDDRKRVVPEPVEGRSHDWRSQTINVGTQCPHPLQPSSRTPMRDLLLINAVNEKSSTLLFE